MTGGMIARWLVLTAALAATAGSSELVAQGRGRGGGAPAGVAQVETRGRLQILTDVLTLDGEQRKQVKTLLDAAYKEAAPIRAELTKTRTALAAAVQGGKSEAEIDAATKAYAAQVTAMTGVEMKALAQILSPLSPEQRKQGTAPSFYLMRGIFLDDKKWDEIPEGRSY
jgi:Spy/CpxP family protein refolding chaperone